MVAFPNLTLNITPPGGSPTNYASKLAWEGVSQTMSITQNFGRQGDTATFCLVDEYATTPNYYIPVLSQIKLIDNTISTTLFAGVVNDPVLMVTGTNRNEWLLNCTDYTFYADNCDVQGLFNGLSVDQIIVLLTAQGNCGVTAATVRNGGFVAPAPVLTQAQLNWGTLSSAWRSLAQLAGSSTPYGWYVDGNLKLHFYDSSTAINSGVTCTTSPTAAGSSTEAHIARTPSSNTSGTGRRSTTRSSSRGPTRRSSPTPRAAPRTPGAPTAPRARGRCATPLPGRPR